MLLIRSSRTYRRNWGIPVVLSLVLFAGGSFRAQLIAGGGEDGVNIEVNINDDGTGQQVLELVNQFTQPLGVDAAELRTDFLGKSFDEIVALENQWAQDHVSLFDATTDEEYRDELETTINGDDGLLGMRSWTDPSDAGFWVPGIVNAIGTDGFTQLVRFHSAFAPTTDTVASDDTTGFRFVAGQVRSYSAASNLMFLNGEPYPGAQNPIFPLAPDEDAFTQLVTFGGKVRDQIDNFYSAFQAGTVSARDVRIFNQAFVLAGLFDLTNSQHNLVDTDGDGVFDSIAGADRTANALNKMAEVLDLLGFPVRLASFSLVQEGFSPREPAGCVTLQVDSDVGFRGGEVAIAYDSGFVSLESVTLADGFPSSTQLFVNETPNNGCPLGDGIHAGVTVAWLNLLGANQSVLSDAGSHEILRYCFAPLDGVTDTSCQTLRFVNCLGADGAPVLNVIGGESGASLLVETSDLDTFDVVPPSIFCPDDFSVRNPGAGIGIEFPTPSAVDSCSGVASVSCDPASGAVFPNGQHLITCTATDNAGNSSSCEFTLTVESANFERGNANADLRRDIADVVTVLLHLFLGLDIPCVKAADANDDGSVNVSDAISMLNHRFQGGPPSPPPVDCGSDPTEDDLDCASFPVCQSAAG